MSMRYFFFPKHKTFKLYMLYVSYMSCLVVATP